MTENKRNPNLFLNFALMLDTSIIVNLLKENTAFAALDDQELAQLASVMTRKIIKKGESVFCSEGKTKLYIVEFGELRMRFPKNKYKHFTRTKIFGELGFINENIRTGAIKAVEASQILAIKEEDLMNPDLVAPYTALKLFKGLAKMVTESLRSKEYISTKKVIEEGEGNQVEFKSSLRWNKMIGKTDKAIEHAVLKTVAAYLNTDGGVLIVGVNDEGESIGLTEDRFSNDDKMLLHFSTLVRKRISDQHMSYVDAQPDLVNGNKVLRIDVEPANVPAYLKYSNEEEFYIRTGPASIQLPVSQIFDYISNRFK